MRSRFGLLRVIGMLAATLGLSACATAFMGSPHVEGGRNGCQAKCTGQGMAVAGMVYMGEYSSACICAVPGAAHASVIDEGAAAAAAGGAVGVELQRRQQQQQAYNANRGY